MVMNCTIEGCTSEIYGMTGLQELDHYRKHLRTKHKISVSILQALEMRADSGQ